MRAYTALALLPALLLPACGGSDPKALTDSGYDALGSSDYAGALEDFEAAREAIGADAAHPQYLSACLGAVEAGIHVEPEKAKEEFLALAQANPSKITDDDFSRIGSKFAGAARFHEAIAILDAGMKAHPESPALAALVEKIKAAAEKAGDKGALSELEGLGYI